MRGSSPGSVGARNGLPGRTAYTWTDRNAEPPEVTAVRERHRALNAERERMRADLEAKLDALAKANPRHSLQELLRLYALAELMDEDDAATGYREPGEDES